MVKSYWVGGGGGLQNFSVSPRPLGFGFLGLGPGLEKWFEIMSVLSHLLIILILFLMQSVLVLAVCLDIFSS